MRRNVLAALLVLASCGGDSDGGPLTPDNLPGAVVSAFCNFYVRCGLISDHATCRSLDLDVEVDSELTAAVNSGSVIFHEDEAAACLAAIGTATCERGHSADSPHCDLVWEGTVAEGGACAIDEQCISQQCNVPTCDQACCAGTCFGGTPPYIPREGESCADNGNCLDSFCDDATLVCTAFRSLGEACQTTSECAVGQCRGVCTKLPGLGEACQPGSSSACADINLYCSPNTSTCDALGLDGDACSQTAPCSQVYECDSTGFCVLGPRLGEPCGPEVRCIDKSYCDQTAGRCAAQKPDGETCESSSECLGDCEFGSGTTGTCVTDPICI